MLNPANGSGFILSAAIIDVPGTLTITSSSSGTATLTCVNGDGLAPGGAPIGTYTLRSTIISSVPTLSIFGILILLVVVVTLGIVAARRCT